MSEQIGIFKFNNGKSAKLCNGCHKIIREQNTLTEEDWDVMSGRVKNDKSKMELCKTCVTDTLDDIMSTLDRMSGVHNCGVLEDCSNKIKNVIKMI